MQIIIDDTQFEVRGETSVLEVAQREGIFIPTLCHHPALDSYGACRLCVVEVKAGGRPGLTASCVLPVSDGLAVETTSPKVKQARKILLELLLAACPGVGTVEEFATRLGVEDTPYAKAENGNECALCGKCVRVCEKIGARAIGFAFRGPNRKVTGPWGKTPDVCLACRACENVCSFRLIKFTQEEDTLTGEPWQSSVSLAKCVKCGRPFASQPLLEHLQETTGLTLDSCPECRKEGIGLTLLGSDFRALNVSNSRSF